MIYYDRLNPAKFGCISPTSYCKVTDLDNRYAVFLRIAYHFDGANGSIVWPFDNSWDLADESDEPFDQLILALRRGRGVARMYYCLCCSNQSATCKFQPKKGIWVILNRGIAKPILNLKPKYHVYGFNSDLDSLRSLGSMECPLYLCLKHTQFRTVSGNYSCPALLVQTSSIRHGIFQIIQSPYLQVNTHCTRESWEGTRAPARP